MKVNLLFMFAGVAFLFCVVFASIGGFWYYDCNNSIEHYEDVIESFEDPEGENYMLFEMYDQKVPPEEHPNYTAAKEDLQEAKDDKGLTPIWFVFAVVLLLVAISLVVIHFILEKRADDKMAASFFVDGGEGPSPREPADK